MESGLKEGANNPLTERAVAALEDAGWNVYVGEEKGVVGGIYLEIERIVWADGTGYHYLGTIDIRGSDINAPEAWVAAARECAAAFDPEEEAAMWLGGDGAPGLRDMLDAFGAFKSSVLSALPQVIEAAVMEPDKAKEREEDRKMEVYVANLGKYNEGELVGGWVSLPRPKAELDAFLRDTVGLELDAYKGFEAAMRGEVVYEEYAIHDFDITGLPGLDTSSIEYASLDALNALAALAGTLNEDDLERVAAMAECDGSLSPLEYANLAAQADEIPFYPYDFFGSERAENWSNAEKLGYTLTEESLAIKMLEEEGMGDFFDFERYGESMSQELMAMDNGYLDCAGEIPDSDRYTLEELKEIAARRMQEPGYFGAGKTDAAQALSEANEEKSHDYMLLDRLRSDCDYYLGAGSGAEKHLWARDVESQIAKMRELWDGLEEKPEWLTPEDIDGYERRMLAVRDGRDFGIDLDADGDAMSAVSQARGGDARREAQER